MKGSYLNWKGRFLWIAIFAISMGFLEAIVVVYLRKLYYPDGFSFPLRLMSADLVTAEWIREITTLVMLAGIGIIAGRNGLQRLFYALFAFGIWDIVYYAALRIFLGWPETLMTWDLLFLIPVSWLGPVLAPVINSLTMIMMALLFIGRQEKGFYIRPGLSDWVLIVSGAVVILYTYLVDYSRLLFESGALSAKESPEAGERLAVMITTYVPDHYKWTLFIIGEALIIAATINVLIRSRKYSKDETVN
ncbi:MAG: hypothetical protein KBB24_01990 [Bacteroidales bacterium]|jgi:hypothetical protein|nr:hypothetical protein [Bacteroidales bacterium]MDX9927588.1 hypothetical protein [Bacteroidales bacterium]HNX82830.1 hypothetical protein [Bacteroidales bacterium]HOC47694.1 hypothetical protein [Bacteroidales bacterium]HPS96603.1 hypothetical protein [Bacteroidales bacterium]